MKWAKGLILVSLAAGLFYCSAQTDQPAESGALKTGSFKAQLNGFQIHYEVHGYGPVVMVVPNSWGITIGGLRGLLGGLEDRLTMVYFEPRVMGSSDPIRVDADMGLAAVRDDFDALRRHLSLDKVSAIGWSNGAANLVFLASEKPETISSAIFVHGIASYSQEDEKSYAEAHPELMQVYEQALKQIQDPSLTDLEKNTVLRDLWLDQVFPLACADRATAKETVRNLFQSTSFSWRHALYSQKEGATFDARDRLSRITMPALILAGEHDMLPTAKAEELHQGIVGSQLVVFPDSGHFAPVEQKEAFRHTVFEFLGVE